MRPEIRVMKEQNESRFQGDGRWVIILEQGNLISFLFLHYFAEMEFFDFFPLITDLTKHLANCCIIPQCLNQSWMKCSQTWIRCCWFFSFFLGLRGIRFYLNAYWDKSWTMFCQACVFFHLSYIFSHHCVHALPPPRLPGRILLMELVAMLVTALRYQ